MTALDVIEDREVKGDSHDTESLISSTSDFSMIENHYFFPSFPRHGNTDKQKYLL